MNLIQELQTLKADLVREIDERIEDIIKKAKQEHIISVECSTNSEKDFELSYSLTIGTGIFKGKRPTAIIFPNSERVDCPTWKQVVVEILKNCCEDRRKKRALMDLRGKILGRNRILLGSEEGKMRSPAKITDALYVETHYDTETMLKILLTRILAPVNYDYSNIKIMIQAE